MKDPLERRVMPPLSAEALRVGSYQSVQVNTDAFGNNIVGDAANEPSIAVDPTNPQRLVIGWRQFDTIASNFRQAGWAYSHTGGQLWTFPGVFQPVAFRSDPVLTVDAQGTFFCFNVVTDFAVTIARSFDAGLTFDTPRAFFGGDKEWAATDRTGGVGDGNIYVIWQRFANCCEDDTFMRSTDGGALFESPIHIPRSPTFGTLAVGPDGAVYAAGIEAINFQNFEQFVISKSTNAQNAGTPPLFVTRSVNMGGRMRIGTGPNPVGLLGQAWVAVDHSNGPTHNNVYMLCSVDPPGSDPMDVMFIRSTDGGQTWSAPLRVNDDANGNWNWFGTLSVAPNGRIDVVWNDTRDSGQTSVSALYYASSIDGGQSFSPNEQISPTFNTFVGWPQQNKIGDYYDMVSDDNGANVAYSATFNGEQDVYFVRIGMFDCNENGVPDEDDIANGTSPDCNANNVPDECEPGGLEDCNANGTPDLCDIFNGTSFDCQPNQVPDECEPDCNGNGQPDDCDVLAGLAEDCNQNLVPDECELAAGGDCNNNGFLDACEIAPAVDDCGDAIIVCPGVAYFGTTADATRDGDVSCAPADDTPDVWYYYEPAGGGLTTFSLCSSGFDTVLSVHSGCPGTAANELACSDDYCGQQSRVSFAATPGQGYWIRVSGKNGAAGEFQLQVAGPPCAFSPDCNDNGVLDICEPDCNDNGRPDECDIADGISADVNGNGYPDECELAGDANCDGLVNAGDIDPFVLAITDAGAYADQYPDCPVVNADANGDGLINAGDIDPFVALLTGS